MKKFFIPLFLTLSLLISKPAFAGNDITITCNSSNCTEPTGLYLFNETNIYPGFTHTQNFSVVNNRNGPCQLTFKANPTSEIPNLLSQKILINISGDNYNLSNYLLSDLLDPNKSTVSLGQINKNSTNNYLWSVTFDSNADNTYKDQTTNFGINFNFECDEEISTSGSVLGSTSSTSNSTQCNNSAPDAPTSLTATDNGKGGVVLSWNGTSSTHDGYLIAFGTSPGTYQYGDPNIGNITNYTVQGLTSGAQYCFYVRSLNGCMPGGRTEEKCVNAGSAVVAAQNPPTGFEPNVLGATTEITPTLTPTSTPEKGNILGIFDQEKSGWWKLLFLILLIPLYLGGRKFFKKK
jgi:hypothetical protein